MNSIHIKTNNFKASNNDIKSIIDEIKKKKKSLQSSDYDIHEMIKNKKNLQMIKW